MNEQAYFALLDAVERAVREHSQESLDTLRALLRSGEVPREAVWDALRQFEGAYYETLASAYGETLGITMGVQQIRALPVSGLALSTALYGHMSNVSAEVLGVIKRHAQGMHDARKLALDIYEGYGFKGKDGDLLKLDPKNRQLPRYLREVLRDGDTRAELRRIIARGQVTALRTPALKAAYLQALDAFDQGAGEKRLANVLRVAYEERMRYFANRIAQTELHRAFSDQKAREFMDEPAVSVLQWRMSATHPRVDICDLHAKLDKYGLGPGCYPKEMAPKPPAHPFCRCKLVPRWDLDAKNAKERAKAEQAFLIQAGDKDGAKIMGSRAKWFAAKTGKNKVEEILNAGKDPLYHLGRVGDVAGRMPAMSLLPNFGSAIIPNDKLAGYALNPDHPTGGNKARRIAAALGFGQQDAGVVSQMVADNLGKYPAKSGASNQWGKSFVVDMPLTGPAGEAIVRTAWIVDKGSDVPRLTSFYVKES